MSVVREVQRSKIQVDKKKLKSRWRIIRSPLEHYRVMITLKRRLILRKVESTDYVSDTDVYLVCLRIRRRCLRQITVIFPLFPNFLAISTFREASRRKTRARVTVNLFAKENKLTSLTVDTRRGKLPSARPRYLLFAQKNSGYLPWNPSD